ALGRRIGAVAELGEHADAELLHSRVQRGAIVGHRAAARGRVALVVAGDQAEYESRIFHRAREWAHLVHGPCGGETAVTRDASPGRPGAPPAPGGGGGPPPPPPGPAPGERAEAG